MLCLNLVGKLFNAAFNFWNNKMTGNAGEFDFSRFLKNVKKVEKRIGYLSRLHKVMVQVFAL